MTGDKNEVIMDETTFGKLSPENRDWIIYNTVAGQGKRIDVLERRHVVHKALSVVGGFIGGLMGVFLDQSLFSIKPRTLQPFFR